MGEFGRLITYVAVIKKEVAVRVVIGLLICATHIVQAVSMAAAVTEVFAGETVKAVLLPAALALAAVILRGILSWWQEWYGRAAGAIVKEKIRFAILDKILSLGPAYLTGKRSGRVQSLILDGIESLEPFLVLYVPQMITVSLAGLGMGICLLFLDPVTGAVIIAAMLLCVVVPYLTVPIVSKSFVSYWTSYAVLNSQYIDAIQGMPTLMAFNASRAKGEELAGNAHNFYTQQIRNTAFSLVDSGLMLILTSIVSTVSVLLAAIRADNGLITVGAVSAILFLAAECARPMLELNNAWHNSFLGLSVASELFGILDAERPVTEVPAAERQFLGEGLPSVSAEHVTFRYPGSRQEALSDVTFSIEKGQKAAIVGRSGSGKSTLVNLLYRFYDTAEGMIAFNGTDIRAFDIDDLRRHVAAVFQDTYLFNDTVRENLRIARPDADEEAIVSAAKAAQAHDFIMALPEGYDTVIGERGVKLSGGERQRLSIARAIIKDAPLLILDEATSSVDAKSEALIQETIEQLAKGRTTILIAHRLSTVRHADRIFVLDEGRLAEQGTHEELLRTDGIYAALVRAQREEVQ